jgi:capsid assembly protease
MRSGAGAGFKTLRPVLWVCHPGRVARSISKNSARPEKTKMKVPEILSSPWAILPEKLLEIREIYQRHLRGENADIEAIEARLGRPMENKHVPYIIDGTTAILSIDGVLGKRMNLFTQISGGTSTQLIESDFQAAMADPAVKSILLAIDSPGGTVDGTENLANEIFAARGKGKPILALGDGTMASAAYWIGSAADRVYASDKSAMIGSIGVVANHEDYSQAEKNAGVKVTTISAGKYKAVANSHEPLSADGRAVIQSMVDHIYTNFVESVARNRAVTPTTAAERMADGKIFLGHNAVAAGLADGISTQSALVRSLNSSAENRERLGTRSQFPEYDAIFRKMALFLAGKAKASQTPAALANRALALMQEATGRGETLSNIDACRRAYEEAGVKI